MANTFDVTVRIPVAFETPEFAAGFIERAVANAMKEAGYVGTPFVIWRSQVTGNMNSFIDGHGIDAHYDGVLPHNLEEKQ